MVPHWVEAQVKGGSKEIRGEGLSDTVWASHMKLWVPGITEWEEGSRAGMGGGGEESKQVRTEAERCLDCPSPGP